MLVYYATLVEMSNDFKKRLAQAYAKDPQWIKILDLLKPDKYGNPPQLLDGLRFRKHRDLIYATNLDHTGKHRLYIPESI